MEVIWSELLVLPRALIPGDLDAREPALFNWYRVIIRGREPYRCKVKSMIFRVCDRSPDEAVVAVSQI